MRRGFIPNLFSLWVIVPLICLFWAAFAGAEVPLPSAKPESVGLSSARLARLSNLLREDTESGKLIGAVALIVRNDKIAYFEKFGYQDKLGDKKMEKDTIFRFYSMSKPITSVALMMLVEEGRIDLADPCNQRFMK